MIKRKYRKNYFITLISAIFIFIIIAIFARKKTIGTFQKSPITSPWSYQSNLALLQAKVSIKNDSESGTVNFEYKNSAVEFEIPLDNPSITNNQKNEISFVASKKDFEAQYQTLDNGLKENLILRKIPTTNQFISSIKTTNADIYLNSNNLPVFLNPSTKEYLFHIQKPYAFDASGQKTYGVTYQILKNDQSVTPKLKGGNIPLLSSLTKLDQQSSYKLVVKVDPQWLFAKERVYPITVDPTIIHDINSEFATGQFNRNIDTGSSDTPITQATGGSISYSGGYTIHTFLSGTATFIPSTTMSVEVLVVAGGGGGGSKAGGGGGAGGYIYNSSFAVTAQTYTVTVGAGGAGSSNESLRGSNGQNSTFSSLTAIGGGGGGSNLVQLQGGSGGSGGGNSGTGASGGAAAAGTAGQGNNGGTNSTSPSVYGSGGGGGQSGAGANGTSTAGGNGGPGTYNSISGSSVAYAGGGGGSTYNGLGTAGTATHGGGNASINGVGTNGSPNTGGGGGGGSYTPTNSGGNGGSGIVIIRYLTQYSGPAPSLESYYQELGSDINTVGLWHLNESVGTTVADSSGNSNTGTLTGTTVSTGLLGNARSFNGTSDYIEITDNNSIDLTNNFTLETWVYRNNDSGGYERIISKSASDSYDYWLQIQSNDVIQCGIQTAVPASYTISGSKSIPVNVWTHVACTLDANNNWLLYVNGVLDNGTISGTAGSARTSTRNLEIGRLGSGSVWYYGLSGKIDEVRISKIARTPEEIKLSASRRPYSTFTSDVIDLTQVTAWNSLSWSGTGIATGDGETPASSTGLVAQWNFNESAGTSAVSGGTCGTSCNGTLTNFANTSGQDVGTSNDGWTYNNRRWGAGALTFDGVDDYIALTDSTQGNFGTGDFSVETWIKPNTSSTNNIVSKFYNTGSYGDGWLLERSSTYGIRFVTRPNTGDTSGSEVNYPSGLPTGIWSHVVVIRNGTLLKIYINGNLVSTSTGSLDNIDSTQAINIGRLNVSGDYRYLNGTLDSTRIYSRALSASEILSNYNSSRLEFQTRIGNTTDANDGSWEAWKPSTDETSVASLDSDVNNWFVDQKRSSPTSCKDILDAGNSTGDGVYTIYPLGDTLSVYCDMTTDGGGWTLVMNNSSGAVTPPKPTWTQVINNNNVTGTFGSNLTIFDQFLGVKYWNSLGPQMRLTQGATPTSISHKALYTFRLDQSNNYSLSMANQNILTTASGTAIPGIYTYATANNFQLSTYDADHDTNGINCSSSYGNVAWWYGACWDGSFWGGGDSGGYQNAPFWAGSTTEYFAWGAIWLRELSIPIIRSNESNLKTEGSGSLKINASTSRIDSNTVALFHLDETSGTGAYLKDSTTNANDGTPSGTSTIDGVSGKARNFNGSSDNIGLNASTNANVTGSISIEAWIKPTLATSGVLIHKDSQYSIQIDSSGNFLWADSSNWSYANFGATNIGLVANKWQHLAVTKSSGIVNVYLDGILKSSKSFGGDITSTANIMRIGCYAGASACGSSYFGGSIDEVRISNVARSAEEITENFRMGRNHTISKIISSTNLSSSNKIPFYIASDRLGTFSQMTIGESAFANYEPDANTVALWHLDDDTQNLPSYYDYDNFEGGPGSSDDWLSRNSVDPDITSATAYTGMYSLHMPSSWGQNFEGGAGEPTTVPYDANTYPYMCMAYKIPAGTVNNMLINVNGAWRSITMTQGEAPTSYTKVASWNPLTADNQWHYKCIDLNTQLTASLGAGAHNITAVIWHDGGGLAAITGQFWIDDFIISTTPFHPSVLPIKDSSDSGNHGQPFGTTLTQGKFGKARNFAVASSDAVSFPPINVGTNYTIDSWIQFPIPNHANWRTIFANNGGTYHHAIVQAAANNLGVYNTSFYPCNWDPTSISGWHHLAEVVSSAVSYTQFYLDGSPICQSATQIINQNFGVFGNYTSKAGTQGMGTAMDEVRFSNIARTPDEIRQAYEIGSRTHNITFDFKAKLNSGNLLIGSTDYSFTIDETPYGSSAMANHIFLEEKIIVKENINGTEYTAQGTVNSVNSSTGAITVTSWDSGSTFPSSGFTVNATVFKWQREYFDVTASLGTHRNTISRLTYRITDASQSANIWFDDFKSSTAYLNNSIGSTITSSLSNRYFQYRSIFTQNDLSSPSSSLNTLTLNYTSNSPPNTPTLDIPNTGATNQSLVPTLKTTATDNDTDNLQYKITLCTDSGMTTNCQTFDQTFSQIGWSGQNVGTSAYSSNSQASYTLQSPLSPNTIYYWKSVAIDPAASNTWSDTQVTASSFTTSSIPNTPTLDSPSTGAINQNISPVFKTTATDSNSDYLLYKITICTDSGMTANCQTSDQSVSQEGWSGQDVGTTAYSSGTQATHTLQYSLEQDTTYYWKAAAIDPAASNTWSDTQVTAFSFTTEIPPPVNYFQFNGLKLDGVKLN